MSTLLPVRHPNRDFFIVDIADASPKDDMASMEHPVFSLGVKPDMRHLEYKSARGDKLRVIPSGCGLATIMDKDILLYCISKLVALANAGVEITPYVELTAHEVMVATNWQTSQGSYKRFENALIRLRGTTIITDVRTGNHVQSHGFGLIDEFDTHRVDDKGQPTPFGRMTRLTIKLSDWTFRAIQAREILSIDAGYFRLRRPLERRLYELARKHVGTKNQAWTIGIEKLREKVGTNAPLKKFRFNLKQIIEDGNIPDYGFALVGDNVIMQRLVEAEGLAGPESYLPLRADTLDKAQKIAAQLRVSVYDLEREWNEWTKVKGTALKSNDAAFMAFCQQKLGSQNSNRVVDARNKYSDAVQLGLALPDMKRRAR